MSKKNEVKYLPEVRERAVRMVRERWIGLSEQFPGLG